MVREVLGFRAFFLISAVLLLSFGCSSSSSAPQKLIGVWTTAQAPYSSRPFAIQRDHILFIQGNGADEFLLCPIASVHKEELEDRVLYSIEYTVDGSSYTLALYYNPANGGRIRFKNQPQILWTIDAPTERIKKILASSQPEPG